MFIDLAVFTQDILVRKGSVVCTQEFCVRVVADSQTGRGAEDLLTATQPDLLLLDLALPGCSPLELAKQCKQKHQSLRTVFYFDQELPYLLNRFVELGCYGFLWKGASITETFHAIYIAHQGGMFLQGIDRLAPEILDSIKSHRDPVVYGGAPLIIHSAITGSLTQREREIANYLARGLTNKEIAATLHISENTLKTHISGIYRKTGLKRRRDWTHRNRSV